MLYLLWAIAGMLMLVWLLAVAGALTTSGWIHVLLLAAILLLMATVLPPRRQV
jgi:hypothetical protein